MGRDTNPMRTRSAALNTIPRTFAVCLAALLCQQCGDDQPGTSLPDQGTLDSGTDPIADAVDRIDTDAAPETIILDTSAISLVVTVNPFSFQLRDTADRCVLSTLDLAIELPDDGGRHFHGPPAAARIDLNVGQSFEEAQWAGGDEAAWAAFDRTLSATTDQQGIHVVLGSARSDDERLEITLSAVENNLHVKMAIETAEESTFNRLCQTFTLAPDEHLFGLGASAAGVDRRGRDLAIWVSDPAAPSSAQGATSPYPIPFLLSTAGYGFWADLPGGAWFQLGSLAPDYWRIEVLGTTIEYDVFVNSDPQRSLRDLTNRIGRAPEPAQWTFGPHWSTRLDPTVSGNQVLWRILRNEGIPVTVIDDLRAFLPHGEERGLESGLSDLVEDLHLWGYKVIGQTAPHIASGSEAVLGDYSNGMNWNYFVADPQGEPYLIALAEGDSRFAATIDLTRDVAGRWFQSLMQRALTLGYDGWTVDSLWDVPDDAVFYNDQTGVDMHNSFVYLAQKAARDLLQRELPDDHLLLSSSGWTGSHTEISLVRAPSRDPSLDPETGLASAVRMGINLGLSGVPYYGAGYPGAVGVDTCPDDRETLLRWIEFSALCPSMFLSDVRLPGTIRGAGNDECQSAFDQQEVLDAYIRYGRLHTRLAPYLGALARQANQTGLPLIRHPYLVFPSDPQVFDITDQYFLGNALLVAPVVDDNSNSRTVYFPQGLYYHWDTGEVIRGPTVQTIDAPSDSIPLFIADGGIVPLLDPDTETLAPEERFDVVGIQDVAHLLDVRAVRSPGTSSITLADGTVLTLEVFSEVTPPFHVNSVELNRAVSHGDLALCAAGCYLLGTEQPPVLWLTTPQGEDLVIEGNGIELHVDNPSAHPRRVRFEVMLPGADWPEITEE